MKYIDVEKFENSLLLSLKSNKKDIEPGDYLQWMDFFNKIKNSEQTDEKKLRQYNILLNTIASKKEALYRNSGLILLKDTLREVIKNIDDIPRQIKGFITPLILGLVVIAGVLLLLKGKVLK